MTDDIVALLRLWSDNAKEQDATEVVVGLCEAADEIERLRAERDEARRWICEEKASSTEFDAKWWARTHAWDCFKEDGK